MFKKIFLYTLVAYIAIAIGIILLEGIKNIENISGIGQLITELALIPIAIIGFLLTYEELKRSQSKSDFDLYFKPKETTKYNKLEKNRIKIPRVDGVTASNDIIYIKNNGRAISQFFQVIFTFPPGIHVKGSNRMTFVENSVPHQLAFYSTGWNEIGFLGKFIMLNNIWIQPNNNDSIKVDFAIYSENGIKEIKEGYFFIDFV